MNLEHRLAALESQQERAIIAWADRMPPDVHREWLHRVFTMLANHGIVPAPPPPDLWTRPQADKDAYLHMANQALANPATESVVYRVVMQTFRERDQ